MTAAMTTVLVAVSLALASEQQPQQPPQAGRPAAQTPANRQTTSSWSYDPQGRRDPFVSLRRTTPTPTGTQNRPPGLPGVAISELMIRGIVRSGNDFIALVQSADGRSFQLRRGARVFDGVVKSIAIDHVIFTQEVNDPLSLVKQREVRKTMRTGDREEEL